MSTGAGAVPLPHVELYPGSVAIDEEGVLLFLLGVVQSCEGLDPDRVGELGSVESAKDIEDNYRDVNEGLRGFDLSKARELHPLHLCYLEIERCASFIAGSISRHVRYSIGGRFNGINDSEWLESSLLYVDWCMSGLATHWGELNTTLRIIGAIERVDPVKGWNIYCSGTDHGGRGMRSPIVEWTAAPGGAPRTTVTRL